MGVRTSRPQSSRVRCSARALVSGSPGPAASRALACPGASSCCCSAGRATRMLRGWATLGRSEKAAPGSSSPRTPATFSPQSSSGASFLPSADSRGTSPGFCKRSVTRSPAATPSASATGRLSQAPSSRPGGAVPGAKKESSTPRMVTPRSERSLPARQVAWSSRAGLTRASVALRTSSARAARKKRGATRAWSTQPSRRRVWSRKLPRSESPTSRAPVSTVLPTSTPSSTALLPRQWNRRLRKSSDGRVMAGWRSEKYGCRWGGAAPSGGASRPSTMPRTRGKVPASSALWVTTTSMLPSSRHSSSSRLPTAAALWRSRLPVGSSASTSVGFSTRARATATRCRSPPDNSAGRCSSRCDRPTRSSRFRARSLTEGPAPGATRVGMRTFSRTVHCGSRWWSWKTKPMERLRKAASLGSGRAKGSTSSRRTVPAVGVSRVPRMYSRVLLPEPEGPMTTRDSPRPRSRSTPRSTLSGPLRVG